MAEQFSIPTPGDIVADRYEIVEEFGRGSYGVVFRARQLGIGRDVALKTLLPKAFLQTDIVKRFEREAQLISLLQHPNVVTLFDFGQSESGVLYMAMELIQGEQLSELIARGPLEPSRALHITRQVLSALETAHREGIVHRDLKPENIILTRLGERADVVKVLDFGIAKLMAGEAEADGALKTLTVQGYVLGTPHYMSPENITGDPVDHRADLYAVGIMLYEMLAGVHPFDAPSPSAVLVRHLNDPPPPLPDSKLEQSAVGRTIKLALAKDPEDRIGSASDFSDILDGRLEPPAPPRTRSPLTAVWIGVVAVLAILLMAVVWVVWPSGGEGELASGGEWDVAVDAGVGSGQDGGDVGVEDGGSGAADAGVRLIAADGGDASSGGDGGGAVVAGAVDVGRVARVDAGREDPGGAAPLDGAVTPRLPMTRLVFDSDPPNAQVTVNGVPIGVTPCQKFVRREGATVRVQFSKIGYKPAVMTLTPTEATQSVSVKLKRGRIKLIP